MARDSSEADFVRAIRHGVNREGRGLMIMHSDRYHSLGEGDLGALVAYVRSVPPVDREHPETRGGPMGRIFLALGLMESESVPLIPAELIDHDAPLAAVPQPDVTTEYGGYLVSIALCAMCHGQDLTGGPPLEPDTPPAPTLAAYGLANGWSEEQFLTTIRSGVTPNGRELDPGVMPWEYYAKMTDEELRAIRLYVASLQP